MDVGFCSIDGTVDYNTTGFLGTGQYTRLPLLRYFIGKDYNIHWFGIKKDGYKLNGKVDRKIIPYDDYWKDVKVEFSRYFERNKRLENSRLKYSISKSVS